MSPLFHDKPSGTKKPRSEVRGCDLVSYFVTTLR